MSALIPYDEFRTGLTFVEVRQMLWSPSDDPSTWRYKRRGTVLGKWHQIKRELYERYLGELGHSQLNVARPARSARSKSKTKRRRSRRS